MLNTQPLTSSAACNPLLRIRPTYKNGPTISDSRTSRSHSAGRACTNPKEEEASTTGAGFHPGASTTTEKAKVPSRTTQVSPAIVTSLSFFGINHLLLGFRVFRKIVYFQPVVISPCFALTTLVPRSTTRLAAQHIVATS